MQRKKKREENRSEVKAPSKLKLVVKDIQMKTQPVGKHQAARHTPRDHLFMFSDNKSTQHNTLPKLHNRNNHSSAFNRNNHSSAFNNNNHISAFNSNNHSSAFKLSCYVQANTSDNQITSSLKRNKSFNIKEKHSNKKDKSLNIKDKSIINKDIIISNMSIKQDLEEKVQNIKPRLDTNINFKSKNKSRA